MASLVTLSQNDNWVEGETEVMETKTQTNHMTVNTWGGKARDEVCPCCWCQDARQQGRAQ